MEFLFIDPQHALYEAEMDLRFRVLREPLGFERGDVAFPFEDASLHLLAIDDGGVVGCVLFHPENDHSGRLFQMAVDPGCQKQGLGSRLVAALEDSLRERGFREVILHARDTAVPFYARLGYAPFGAPYIEVNVPHQNMRKAL